MVPRRSVGTGHRMLWAVWHCVWRWIVHADRLLALKPTDNPARLERKTIGATKAVPPLEPAGLIAPIRQSPNKDLAFATAARKPLPMRVHAKHLPTMPAQLLTRVGHAQARRRAARVVAATAAIGLLWSRAVVCMRPF